MKRLKRVMLVFAVIPIATLIATFVVAGVLGHYDNDVPFISDTFESAPGRCVFIVNLIALRVALSCFVLCLLSNTLSPHLTSLSPFFASQNPASEQSAWR